MGLAKLRDPLRLLCTSLALNIPVFSSQINLFSSVIFYIIVYLYVSAAFLHAVWIHFAVVSLSFSASQ